MTIAAEPKPTVPQARRFEHPGPLAIRPMAMFELFFESSARETTLLANDQVAVVTVSGPLCQQRSRWEDSYPEVLDRFAAALDSPARAVVLRMHSPGGVLYGAIDAARGLRARADAAGKPFIAYVEGEAASAAYALAAAADQIVLGTNAIVGSIGVMQCRPDLSLATAARGINVAIIASGAKKAYGNPDVPLTAEEFRDTKALIDQLAAPLFQLVAERRGLTPEIVASYEAGLFTGPAAISARLADRIMGFDALIASLARGESIQMKYAEIAAALGALAAGDGEDSEKARKMLASITDESAPADPPKEPEAATGGDEPGDGDTDADDSDESEETDEPVASSESDGDDTQPSAAKPGTAPTSIETQLAAVQAQLARSEQERVNDLLVGRPKELRTALRGMPYAKVQKILAAMPKPGGRRPPVTTLGGAQGTPDAKPRKPAANPEVVARIDRALRTPTAQKRVTKLVNGTLFFDVPEDYDPSRYGQH